MYPKFVTPSYVVAFGYCLADSVSAGYQVMAVTEDVGDERSSGSNKTLTTSSKEKRAAIAFFDTLLWQSLASVAIPGGVIQHNCKSNEVHCSSHSRASTCCD